MKMPVGLCNTCETVPPAPCPNFLTNSKSSSLNWIFESFRTVVSFSMVTGPFEILGRFVRDPKDGAPNRFLANPGASLGLNGAFSNAGFVTIPIFGKVCHAYLEQLEGVDDWRLYFIHSIIQLIPVEPFTTFNRLEYSISPRTLSVTFVFYTILLKKYIIPRTLEMYSLVHKTIVSSSTIGIDV
jgi:hypothetical protein